MTSPEQPPSEPAYADRVYRSPMALVGGVLLLALTFWIGGDAVIRGEGRTPWLGLTGLLVLVPMIVAFTLRPAVFAGEDRLRIRNPFRTITLPWASVADVRAGYSSEVTTQEGAKYQLWSVPVSLRQRKQAARRQALAARGDRGRRAPVNAAVDPAVGTDAGGAPWQAPADRTIAELRELAEHGATRPSAKGEPQVRWAYEILGPAVVGAVAFAVLLAVA
ncbi:PH domain-containing protein [Streptomyces sp. NPDC054841]